MIQSKNELHPQIAFRNYALARDATGNMPLEITTDIPLNFQCMPHNQGVRLWDNETLLYFSFVDDLGVSLENDIVTQKIVINTKTRILPRLEGSSFTMSEVTNLSKKAFKDMDHVYISLFCADSQLALNGELVK